jgi:hypothetical protein
VTPTSQRIENAPKFFLDRISDRLYLKAMEHRRVELRTLAQTELATAVELLRAEIRQRRTARPDASAKPSAAA